MGWVGVCPVVEHGFGEDQGGLFLSEMCEGSRFTHMSNRNRCSASIRGG